MNESGPEVVDAGGGFSIRTLRTGDRVAFFGGLTEEEIAKEPEKAEITVKRDRKFARAWLAAHLPQTSQKSE